MSYFRRWNYVDEKPAPNLNTRILAKGVRAEYVQPLFPSVSAPSWITVITGGWCIGK